MSVLRSSKLVAKECRKEWQVASLTVPLNRTAYLRLVAIIVHGRGVIDLLNNDKGRSIGADYFSRQTSRFVAWLSCSDIANSDEI